MASIATNLLTAEGFYEFAHRPENCDRHFELERGEVIEMPPRGKYHGFVCGNISARLWNHAQQHGKGYVCTNDAGVIVEVDPDTVRGPDVTYYEDRETADDMQRKYAAEPPLLAVDVLSPHDRINRVIARATQMLRRGVKMVWIVDPEARDVTVHRAGRDPMLLTETDQLAGENALPGFACAVSDLFTMPGQVRTGSGQDT